ncbi:hypothetical protein KVR01_004037 [Diaporthe batatas]|nr:uncharacterized protein KVR01_004037 [Diaporthe batatas]KAG8165485.1 hypothetical protein KVR01_004037 [Diaporthe batatas]
MGWERYSLIPFPPIPCIVQQCQSPLSCVSVAPTLIAVLQCSAREQHLTSPTEVDSACVQAFTAPREAKPLGLFRYHQSTTSPIQPAILSFDRPPIPARTSCRASTDQDRDKDRLRHHIPQSPARPDLAVGGPDSAYSSSPRRSSRNRANSASNSSHTTNMPQYTSRDVGDPTQIKKNKQSMADLKLRRLTELNNRLREDLERERIPVSQASKSIIAYCNSTRDYMVVTVWGVVPKGEDPYAPQQSGGCCLVM